MNLYTIKYEVNKITYFEKNKFELEDYELLCIIKYGYYYDYISGMYIIDVNPTYSKDQIFVDKIRVKIIKLLRDEKLNQLLN